jgi:hypothetical protein
MIVRLLSLALLMSSLAFARQTTVPPSGPTTTPTTQPSTQPAINRFQREIDRYRELDAADPFAPGGIVFVGSSSIRGWSTLAEDFPLDRVLNRGFGGSHLIDVVRHADALVLRHRPRVVVLYAGENDIASGRSSPESVARSYHVFCDLIWRDLPDCQIVVIGLKPSPVRAARHSEYLRTNQ